MLQKTKVVRPQVKDPSLLEEHTDRMGEKGMYHRPCTFGKRDLCISSSDSAFARGDTVPETVLADL